MSTETISTLDFSRTYTNAEFEALPNDGRWLELIEGKVVEKMPGDIHSRISRLINNHLFMFDPKEQLGTPWLGASFEMGQGWMPIPDLGFMIASRVPPKSLRSVKGVPDLVVEVHSPSDLDSKPSRDAAAMKIAKYQSFGVRLVWAINPITQTIEVYRPGQAEPIKVLDINDQLDGEEIIPGFVMPVKALFE